MKNLTPNHAAYFGNSDSALCIPLPTLPQQQPIMALTAGPAFSWLYDSKSRNFMYFSSNVVEVLGWEKERLHQSSVSGLLRRCHPEDLPGVVESLRKVHFELEKKDYQDNEGLYFSMDFRYRSAKGRYIRLLLHAVPQKSDQNGVPVSWTGLCSDISYLKMEGGVSFTMRSNTQKIVSITNANEKKVFTLFSNRERQILKLLAQGFSTQRIEDKLNISQHTVRTHRRNMHKKCKVANTSQLINLAIREGYI